MYKFLIVSAQIFCLLFSSVEAQASLSCSRFLRHSPEDFVFTGLKDQGVDAYFNGKSIAYIQFSFEDAYSSVSISYMNVDHDFRRNGLSKMLLAEVLKLHPNTKVIKSSLTETNENVFSISQFGSFNVTNSNVPGSKVFDAVKQTPAYLIRAALGFSKIVHFSHEHYWLVLHVEKDDPSISVPRP